MSNKITSKDIKKMIKEQFKAVDAHLKLLKLLHELSLNDKELSLAHKNLKRSEFESKVKEFVGERDFYYIKDFMEHKKAS